MEVYTYVRKEDVAWSPETVLISTMGGEAIYARIPPLVMFRLLCGVLGISCRQWRAMVLDVKRVFLHGRTSRRIVIRLPSDDPKSVTHYGVLAKARTWH
eukprot:3387580-Amphidinium_carterae.1